MKLTNFLFKSLAVFLVLINFASAKSTGAISTDQDWSLFKIEQGGQEICYVVSIPIEYSKFHKKRGKSFFMVTKTTNDADEISTSSGFFYKDNSNLELSFGSKRFYLFPHKNYAWAMDKNEDIAIIKEMQKQDDFIITAIDQNNKIVSDRYSLIGFNQAYQKMRKECQ